MYIRYTVYTSPEPLAKKSQSTKSQSITIDVLLLYICAAIINSDQGYFYLTHLVMQRLVEGSIVTYAKWL